MDEIKKTAEVLNSGGLVIFPTETVYGVGCLVSEPEAIEKLYRIKHRDSGKPSLVLIEDISQGARYVTFNPSARALAKSFWPGPLTICLTATEIVPRGILGPSDTLGVRVSSNRFISQLQPRLRAPLLAPSANIQGGEAPTRSSEIDKNLASKVNYVVNLEPEGEKPSTVILFNGRDWQVVRQGDISQSQIEEVLKYKE